MTLVLDASAAYRMLVSGQWDAAVADNDDFMSPDLIVSELLNARWKVARSGNVAPEISATLNFFARLRIVPSLPYAPLAAQLADRLAHPVYDCMYVALAQQENAKLLTTDVRLARKLRAHKLGGLLF